MRTPFKSRCVWLALAVAVWASPSSVQGGTFSNNLNSEPSGVIEIRDPARWEPAGGVNGSGYISLTDAVGSLNGTIVLPDLDAGQAIGGFTASFKVRIGGGTSTPADGMSFNFAREDDSIVSGGFTGEGGTGTGLAICFDSYNNSGEAPALNVKVDGQLIARTWFSGSGPANRTIFTDPKGNQVSLETGDVFADVKIEFKDNLLSLQFKGLDVYKNLVVPFTPIAGRFVFGARTGGSTDNHWIDDLTITTTPPVTLITSMSPLPGATDVAGNATIDIVLADGSRQIQTSSVQLTVNGQTVSPTVAKAAGSGTTTITFDPPGDLPPEAPVTVKLVYSDDATPPNAHTVNYSFTTKAITATLIAIDDKTIWRYDRSGTDLGTAWKDKNFNDSAWEQGPALIADETGTTAEPIRTPISRYNDAGDYVSTFYFRIHFNFTGNTGAARLQLRHVVDDGALFYLNGTEVLRFGYAAGATVAFDNNAAGGHENAYVGPVDISTASLVSGDNVLAVEVHQSGGSSSDVVFGATLEAVLSNPVKTAIDTLSPAPDALDVAVNTAFAFTLRDGAQRVQPNSVQLSINGQTVTPTVNKASGATTTSVSYQPTANLPAGSAVTVKLVFSDDATPPNVTTKEYSFSTKGGTMLLAIDDNTKWRYDRSGLDLGTAWKEKSYNDSAWPEGAALLADESGSTAETVRTPISRMDDAGTQFVTLYVRTHFNFSGDPKATKLILRHVVDDGAVFYLNGVEISRFGLAAGAALNFTTTFSDHENAFVGPIDVPAASLVAGDNVLAVEVHQSSATSSDLVFGAELRSILSGAPPVTAPKFTSTTRSGNNVVIQWTGTGTLESADTVIGPWSAVANAQSPYSGAIVGTSKFYRLKQ